MHASNNWDWSLHRYICFCCNLHRYVHVRANLQQFVICLSGWPERESYASLFSAAWWKPRPFVFALVDYNLHVSKRQGMEVGLWWESYASVYIFIYLYMVHKKKKKITFSQDSWLFINQSIKWVFLFCCKCFTKNCPKGKKVAACLSEMFIAGPFWVEPGWAFFSFTKLFVFVCTKRIGRVDRKCMLG